MISTSDLVYPVIVIDKKGYVYVCVDEDTLTTMNSTSLKRGACKGGIVVDSDLVAAKVNDIIFVSGKGPFWGYTIRLDRMCKVKIILGEPFKMQLSEVKSAVRKDLRRGLVSVDSEFRKAELERFDQAGTMDQLVELLLPHADLRELWR